MIIWDSQYVPSTWCDIGKVKLNVTFGPWLFIFTNLEVEL